VPEDVDCRSIAGPRFRRAVSGARPPRRRCRDAALAIAVGNGGSCGSIVSGHALWLIVIRFTAPNILNPGSRSANYGFSDATKSSSSSRLHGAFVYGRAMLDAGLRGWRPPAISGGLADHVAHVFLFTIFLGNFLRCHQFENPLYSEEMGIMDFLKQPDSLSPRRCC